MNPSGDVLTRFGQRVRSIRLERGFSQEELSARCHLDRTYISSLERGKRNVGLRNVAAIAEALGVSISQLFEGLTGE